MMNHLVFYDVNQPPFSLHGVYYDGTAFRRLPQEVGDATSPNVAHLCHHASGGRLRFKTNSGSLALRAKIHYTLKNMNLTPISKTAFDLYLDKNGRSVFLGNFKTDFENRLDYTCELQLPQGEKELTLYFPTYAEVTHLEIGLEEGASLEAHTPYRHALPIVYYGSSITQGASASRPGLAYPAVISRRFDVDFINLGFSGSCKGEEAIREYMATLDMAAFVCDFDHNCSSAEKLRMRHYPVYETIRRKNPDLPIFMITRPDFSYRESNYDRRAVVMESYLRAWNAGDRNVYFIDGSAFFNGADSPLEMTIDCTHPTDEGMARMADYIGSVLREALDL